MSNLTENEVRYLNPLTCPRCRRVVAEGIPCHVQIDTDGGTFAVQSGFLRFACRFCDCISDTIQSNRGRLYLREVKQKPLPPRRRNTWPG